MKKTIRLFSIIMFCFSLIFLASCGSSSNDERKSDKQDVYYDITFKDYDGTQLKKISVKEGSTPSYGSSDPKRATDDAYYYTFSGWNPKIVKASSDAEYIATYSSKAKIFNITYELDGGANNVNNPTTYTVEMQNVNLLSPTKNGYTFEGWKYKNDIITEINTSNKCNMELSATWSINKYSVLIDNQVSGVTISGYSNTNEYEYGSTVTLVANNIPKGVFFIWERSDGEVYEGSEYSFEVPSYAITITTSTSERYFNKMYFGNYPQTMLDDTEDSEIITELNTLADAGTWMDYEYFYGGSTDSYMYYQDIDCDNDGLLDYRGVYFTKYRLSSNSATLTTTHSYQQSNGYSLNTKYWFKYEPIEWSILCTTDNKIMIVANSILDSQEYCPWSSTSEVKHNGGVGYANNYELSFARKWLKDIFYNTAFSGLEKNKILCTEVDNSSASTASALNGYACNNTNDFMFLLSYQEVMTYLKNKDVICAKGTDYSKIQGLSGNSYYLRTPFSNSSVNVSTISSNGGISYKYADDTSSILGDLTGGNTCNSYIGIRPACWISL